ncbi:MAG: hypothetical protein KDD53_09335 [Bdellovibrionales bacterium]|nr:hypothetical protein [Bdellovibrionales bacterium]
MRQETKPKNSKSSSSVPMREVFTVDSFANGIAFGSQKIEIGDDPRAELYLRLKDEASVVPIRSRYVLHKNNPLHELELNLMSLSQQGILARSVIYLGTSTDPFPPSMESSMRA